MSWYASKRAVSYELTCRKCGETLPSPNGSLFWTVEEMEIEKTELKRCPSCKRENKIPGGLR